MEKLLVLFLIHGVDLTVAQEENWRTIWIFQTHLYHPTSIMIIVHGCMGWMFLTLKLGGGPTSQKLTIDGLNLWVNSSFDLESW